MGVTAMNKPNDSLFAFAVANEREHAARTLLDKLQMDALRAEFMENAAIEGPRLNREAEVEQANWRCEFQRDEP